MLDERVAQRLVRSGWRVVVTGAGGWLGLATLDSLAGALGAQFATRVFAFGSAAKDLQLQGGMKVAQRPLDELASLAPQPTLLLHYAFLTKDRAEQMDVAHYRAANAAIGDKVLAALASIGTQGVFVASSGAAYKAEDIHVSEAMRLYGSLKVEDEARFVRWAENTAKRLVIGRIFNVTGPYINKHQAYALASFILDGLAGRDIVVRSPREVVRAYVAISELVSLVLAELSKENTGIVRFDTGGEPLELAAVAEAVAMHFDGVGVVRTAITQAPADCYYGNVTAYAAKLAQHGIESLPLAQQIAKTIDYLRAAQ
jgi:UDP-glucuronate decarboxylase